MEQIEEMRRISWDELFMWIVRLQSMRSVCQHYQVGVAFVKDCIMITGGYNGPPRGEVHCNKAGCSRVDHLGKKLPAGTGLCRGAHAEMNAVFNSASLGSGIALRDTTVYCTYSPCYSCAKHLVNLGIKEFVYELLYDNEAESERVSELFTRHNIKLRQFEVPDAVLKNIMKRYLKEYSVDEVMAILGTPTLGLKIL